MKNVADVYHLTPVQRDVLTDPHAARVVQTRRPLKGALDGDALERAWQQLLARHAMLRTCFLTEQLNEPVQVVRQQLKLIYERYDLRGVDTERQRAELDDLLRMDRQREFTPAKAPLFRVLLMRLGEEAHELVVSHHPVLLDRRSVSLLLEEVVGLCQGESSEVAAAPLFRDYVAWVERQDLAGAQFYWRNRLRSPLKSVSEFSHRLTFPATDEGLIIAAWALVLMHERNASEVSIGVTSRQPAQTLADSKRIIGLAESLLPLQLAFNGQSLDAWVQYVAGELQRIQRYAHVSQSQIRHWLDLKKDQPLFDSIVTTNETSAVELYTDSADERLLDQLRETVASLTLASQYVSTIAPSVREEPPTEQSLDFSLFYFADDNAVYGEDKYRLYREGALFADRHQLTAVWTPERHFHEKAGLYPNPSVLSGALAAITNHVKLRAGSVVLPLHNALRVAEEWSIVDNLSNGRVGVSFTSGWMPNDFAFFPERYPNKREEMLRGIEDVQRLWGGDPIAGRDGLNKEIELRIFPKPIQAELPIWLTCSGGPEMFEKAGELGFHCLTALLTQSLEEVAPKIKLYRDALVRHGHDPHSGKVTMMMHTFVGEDAEAVLQKVRAPLTKYLKSHLNLIETGAQSLNLELDVREHADPEKYRDQLAEFAFQRYYRTASLIGTPTSCLKMIEKLKAIGVDEVACLIDFGVDVDSVLESLDHLVVLRELSQQVQPEASLAVSTAAHV